MELFDASKSVGWKAVSFTELSSLYVCEERNNFHTRSTGLILIQLFNLVTSFYFKLSSDPHYSYLHTQEVKRPFKVLH